MKSFAGEFKSSVREMKSFAGEFKSSIQFEDIKINLEDMKINLEDMKINLEDMKINLEVMKTDLTNEEKPIADSRQQKAIRWILRYVTNDIANFNR